MGEVFDLAEEEFVEEVGFPELLVVAGGGVVFGVFWVGAGVRRWPLGRECGLSGRGERSREDWEEARERRWEVLEGMRWDREEREWRQETLEREGDGEREEGEWFTRII